jgi:hypothetical protein
VTVVPKTSDASLSPHPDGSASSAPGSLRVTAAPLEYSSSLFHLEWQQTDHSCSIDAIGQLLHGRGNGEEAETRGQPSSGNGRTFRGVGTEGDNLHVNPAGGTCVTGMISCVIQRLYVDDTRSVH